jgi:hypothetical protein
MAPRPETKPISMEMEIRLAGSEPRNEISLLGRAGSLVSGTRSLPELNHQGGGRRRKYPRWPRLSNLP